jgi:hypothetical protein
MRTVMGNRWLSTLMAAGYVLAVTTASLFHNHAAQDGGGCCHGHSLAHAASADCHHGASHQDSRRPSAPAQCPSDGGHCPVCHFLGQKPAPAAEVAAAISCTLVQEVSSPAPARMVVGVFSAWQSRAPPVFA